MFGCCRSLMEVLTLEFICSRNFRVIWMRKRVASCLWPFPKIKFIQHPCLWVIPKTKHCLMKRNCQPQNSPWNASFYRSKTPRIFRLWAFCSTHIIQPSSQLPVKANLRIQAVSFQTWQVCQLASEKNKFICIYKDCTSMCLYVKPVHLYYIIIYIYMHIIIYGYIHVHI